jgi:hypothetical protein
MLIAVTTFVLLTTTAAWAADVGLSSERLKRLGQVLQREVDARKCPGAVIHRTPAAGGYRDVTRVAGGSAAVSPEAFPDVVLTLAEVFA